MDIQVLPQDLVNQIAAGEVVERPAHMVKELVENSIDAGCSEIEIEISSGGRFFSIKDNGYGIKKDQLAVALARHATSKINKIDDLWQLSSFGFRGEALASISAVSDFNIASKNIDSKKSYSINCEFGKFSELEESSCDQGTHIVIKDLFKNIPARLKFLKTEAYETTQIKNVLKAMAMSHPEVGFRVKVNSELIFYWPIAKNRKKRVSDILEIEDLYSAQGELDGSKVEIVYSSPNKTVKSRRQIWSFVQNRWVQDKTISSALVDAYRSLLMHGEYPYAVCFVEIDSEDIDVNIHPTKSQVKFRNSSDIYKLVYRNLRSHIETAPWLEKLLPKLNSKETIDSTEGFTLKYDSVSKQKPLSFKGKGFDSTQFNKKTFENPVTIDQLETLKPDDLASLKTDAVIIDKSNQGSTESASEPVTSEALSATSSSTESSGAKKWSNLQVLGQLNLTYILTQNEKSLVLVDQHAAHERVVFERLMSSFEQQDFEVQSLLLPQVINLSEDHVKILIDHKEDIQKMGIEIDSIGSDAIAVRSLPSFVKEKSLKKSLETMAMQIESKGGSVELKNMVGDVFASMACHSVVRAGQSLSLQEMTSLLEQMDEFPLSSFCPHGRPVFVERSFTQVEKDFGRIT